MESRATTNLLSFATPACQVFGVLVVLLGMRQCTNGVASWWNRPKPQTPIVVEAPPQPRPVPVPKPRPVQQTQPTYTEPVAPLPPPPKPRHEKRDFEITATARPSRWSEPVFLPHKWYYSMSTPNGPVIMRINGGDPLTGCVAVFDGYHWEGRDEDERPKPFAWPKSVDSVEFKAAEGSPVQITFSFSNPDQDAPTVAELDKAENSLVLIPSGQWTPKLSVAGRAFRSRMMGSSEMKIRIRINFSTSSMEIDWKTPGTLGVKDGVLYAIDESGERTNLDQKGPVQSLEFQSRSEHTRAVIVEFEP